MHRLLKRQISKLFGENPQFSNDLLAFIELINSSYHSFQNDFNQLERTLELSSKESFKELSDFQSAVDTAAIVSVTDTKGTILLANQNFSHVSGYSIGELIGSNHNIVNSGFHSQSFFEKMWNTIKGGEVWQGQVKNKKKNGDFYWTNTNIIPLINDQGIAYQFVAIRFDITERKIAEEKLIQSQKNLAEILAAINRTTATIEFTPEGIITEANQLFLDLIGYTKEEIIGKHHQIFVEENEDNYKDFWKEIGKGKIVGGEYKRVKKNGESLWIIGNYNPVLDENHQVKHIVKFVVDITDRKLAENNLIENERLLIAINKASSMLLTNIDFDEAIINALACIGNEVKVDSVYIYENHLCDNNTLAMSQRYEWLKENNEGKINNPEVQNISYSNSGFNRWYQNLSKGISIKGLVNEFPEEERSLLESKNIISLIAVPIFISDEFWGFIGFDSYSLHKDWTTTDENILRTLANNIGGALERQKAENKLKESEGKFRLLIESATDMFYYTDDTGLFTYVNEIATNVTGFTINELLEKRYIDLVRPDYKKKVEAFYLNQAYKDDNVTYLEFPIITKQGKEVWVGQNVQLIYKEGKFSGVQAIARDITALKVAQFDLINSKNFLNNILNAIPNPVFVKNKNHKWVLVNDAYANLLNLKKEAIIGKTDREFLSKEDAEYYIAKDDKLFESKAEDSYETVFENESETKTLFIKKSLFSTDDSKEFLVGVITDITEIKNQQNEIFLLNKITEQISDAISVADYNGKMIYVNESRAKVLGKTREEMVGSTVMEMEKLFPTVNEWRAHFDEVKEKGELLLQGVNIRKDSSEYPVEASVKYLKVDEQEFIVAAVRDITERNIQQKEILDKSQILNAILSEMPSVLFRINKEGLFTQIQGAGLKRLGLKDNELIGMNVFDVYNKTDYPLVNEQFKNSLKTLEPSYYITEGNDRNGQWYFDNFTFKDITQENGIVGFALDITERKLIESKLQESETRFRSLAQNSSDIITILKPDGTAVYESPSFFRIFGYDEKDVIGNSIFNFVHPDDIALVSEEFGRGLSEGGVSDAIEFRFKHQNGNWIYIEAIGNNLIDIQGINGIVVNSRDITERKKAQEEVEKLKAFYEKILNKIPADIVVFDKQHKYLFINPLSIKNDELREWLIGKDDYDYCELRNRPKEIADLRRKLFNEVFDAKVQYEFEESVTNDKGEKIWMLRRMFPVLNSKNEVENIIGFGLDITDRKLAEIKILKAQSELEEAQHIAKVGGWEIDRETRSITWTNEMYIIHELPFNYVPTIATSYDFYTDETRSLVVEKFKAAIDNMEEFELEAKIKTAKGNIVEIRTKGVPVIENNKVKGLRGIFQDITQEKEAERQLKEYSEELEMKNKELDQFAYIVSHDLKAPLRGINNLSLWIEEDLGDLIEGEIKASFEMMRGRVKRMELLINGILEYSRAGRVKQEVETFELKPMLDELVEALSPAEKFKITIPNDLPKVTAERISFEQIFTNYISNGIKYNNNPEPTITVSYKINHGMYEFCVADNGDGIDKQFHDKVFVIFQTLQSRDTYESTGVGLAIVKKIVEDKGGKVWIESEKGQGAKFYFSWPVEM
ncbi:MAG: PAS domain S-box protein [Bacteroidia bacterium]